MKIIEKQDATRPLAEYAAEIRSGTVIVTDHGRPVAALVPLENDDMETVDLSTNPQLMQIIERSRAAVLSEGAISAAELRARME